VIPLGVDYYKDTVVIQRQFVYDPEVSAKAAMSVFTPTAFVVASEG
jgi:hypothetical protein